jgi:hypothetical protein
MRKLLFAAFLVMTAMLTFAVTVSADTICHCS